MSGSVLGRFLRRLLLTVVAPVVAATMLQVPAIASLSSPSPVPYELKGGWMSFGVGNYGSLAWSGTISGYQPGTTVTIGYSFCGSSTVVDQVRYIVNGLPQGIWSPNLKFAKANESLQARDPVVNITVSRTGYTSQTQTFIDPPHWAGAPSRKDCSMPTPTVIGPRLFRLIPPSWILRWSKPSGHVIVGHMLHAPVPTLSAAGKAAGLRVKYQWRALYGCTECSGGNSGLAAKGPNVRVAKRYRGYNFMVDVILVAPGYTPGTDPVTAHPEAWFTPKAHS